MIKPFGIAIMLSDALSQGVISHTVALDNDAVALQILRCLAVLAGPAACHGVVYTRRTGVGNAYVHII